MNETAEDARDAHRARAEELAGSLTGMSAAHARHFSPNDWRSLARQAERDAALAEKRTDGGEAAARLREAAALWRGVADKGTRAPAAAR